MTQPKVAIRLGTEGKDQIVRDFKDVGDAGDAAANRAAKAFERAAQDMESSQRRATAAAEKFAFLLPQANTASGLSLNAEKASQPSTSAFREYQQQQAMLQQQAQALRAAIDPAWAAQQRFNTEMSHARTLISAGVITLDEYCAKLRIEQGALEQVTAAQGRARASSGALGAGVQQLTLQAGDMVTMWAMNAPPMQIFVSQAAQVTGALGLMTNGAKGVLGWLGTPWGQAFMGAATVAGILAVKLLDGGSAADSMSARQSTLAGMIDQTTGRLKEQNQALVQNQILLAKTDGAKAQQEFDRTRQSLRILRPGDVDLANIARFAAETGQTSRAAQMLADLSKAKPWLAGQAQSMTQTLGTMTEQARTIVQAQAQARLLASAGRPGDAKTAFGDFSRGSSTAANMAEINARARLAAAVNDVERAEAKLTLTRQQAEAQLKAGTITEAQATAQIAGAERQLNAAQESQQKLAQGRSAAARAQRQEERESDREAKAAARLALEQEKARNSWLNSYPLGKAANDNFEAEGKRLKEVSDYMAQQRADTAAGTVLLNLEWELRGKSREEIEKALELRRYQMEIERQMPGLTAEQVAELVKAKEAQLSWAEQVDKTRMFWDDLRSRGENAVGRLFDITSAESWGKRVKSIILELINEFIRLQAMKALFGSSSGGGGGGGGIVGSLVGLASSALGSIGGGGSTSVGGGGGSYGLNRSFAAIGHEYTPAGAMLVGENGPEIVDMPRGARVMTASDSRRAMGAASGNVTYAPVYQIDATGADQAAIARLEAKLDSMDRDFANRTLNTVSEARDRLYLRFGN